MNLYGFVYNGGVNGWDLLGLMRTFFDPKPLLLKAKLHAVGSPFHSVTNLGPAIDKLIQTYVRFGTPTTTIVDPTIEDRGSWNWVTNTMILSDEDDESSVIHEVYHMYDDVVNSGIQLNGESEGKAYGLEAIYRLSEFGYLFSHFFDEISGPQDTESIVAQARANWRNMWSGMQFGGLHVFDNSTGKPVNSLDFRRIRSELGADFSCMGAAKILNESPLAKKWCILFRCDDGLRQNKRGDTYIIEPGNEIHISLY